MKCMDKKYLTKSLDLVGTGLYGIGKCRVRGNTVRRLVEEISKLVLSAGTGINHDG